jgi:hypothetical protein
MPMLDGWLTATEPKCFALQRVAERTTPFNMHSLS